MSKAVKKITGSVSKIFGGIMGAPAMPTMPQSGPDPWEEYTKGRSEMEAQRAKDLSGMKARLGASGLAAGSEGWESAMQSLYEKYDTKLKDFGSQAYFDSIRGRSGFGGWSDQEPAAGAGNDMRNKFGGFFAQLLQKKGLKLGGGSEWWQGSN